VRLLLVLLVGGAAISVQAKQQPPNILFIVPDDQNTFASRTDLAPVPVSPNMNRIEAKGVSFLNANCTAPVCNPSRTSFLSGLRPSPHRADTIVVYFSDHGYEFGDKHNWSKGTVREGSARVPLIISGPGLPQDGTSTRPVSLLDLYPTLVELAGLPVNPDNEGRSFAPLLSNPNAKWEHAAVTTSGFRNHAVRTERWRFIRYENGAEELYDHKTDPLGRTNLAANPEFTKWKRKLGRWLPGHDEPVNPPIESGDAR
jgi:arylsulfatase A-like enzyme